jgi:hypothetical protein
VRVAAGNAVGTRMTREEISGLVFIVLVMAVTVAITLWVTA